MNLPNKFQCHYRLTFQFEENGEIYHSIVTDPISVQFNVSKALFQSTFNSTITVYNLDASTRESIYQDKILLNPEKRKFVTLEAGYGDTLTLVCLGYIQQCYSERQGTDFVTSIEVLDPDVLNQYTSVTFQAGTTYEEAYKFLVSQFPNLQQGECGNINGEFLTATVFDGNAFWAINELTGGHTFVDKGTINTLNDNEVLKGYQAYLISSETGLLGTPKRYDAVLEVSMLFEPTIRVGQLVEIQSSTWPDFNGQYKVLGYEHNCMISGSQGGTRTTTLQLQYIKYLTNSNVNLTHNPQGSSPSFIINNEAKPVSLTVDGDVRSIYEYIKANNGNVPNKKIAGTLFTWKDLLLPAGTGNKPSELFNQITVGKLAACKAVASRLTSFANQNYPNKKVTINSGWRSTQNNARLEGSAKNSQHLLGKAIDFKISGQSPSDVFAKAKASNLFKGVGKYSSFTHVDVRS